MKKHSESYVKRESVKRKNEWKKKITLRSRDNQSLKNK